MPGRITINVANDVAELSQALGIVKFVNVGLSGGGQHAIATGLDTRSVGVVTVGSLAPIAELGEDFYTGMQQADLDEYADALQDIDLLVARFQKWQDGDLGETITGPELSERDKLASNRPTWKVLLDSCAFTMEQGWGWVADDYSSYLKPWGFDPRDVKVPAVIWQGGLDKNVPSQHGIWLANNMPSAKLELRVDESHLGIFVNYEEEIMQSAIALLNVGSGDRNAKNEH
jgi:pimeloyl-ACP methyl ester carboxylesterase